jgi:hypothetical protein
LHSFFFFFFFFFSAAMSSVLGVTGNGTMSRAFVRSSRWWLRSNKEHEPAGPHLGGHQNACGGRALPLLVRVPGPLLMISKLS